jgi:hypothetical protein
VPTAPTMQATINLEITICTSRWASALPVGERKRRLVAVLWAALGQAAACQCPPVYRRRDQSTMARREYISRLRWWSSSWTLAAHFRDSRRSSIEISANQVAPLFGIELCGNADRIRYPTCIGWRKNPKKRALVGSGARFRGLRGHCLARAADAPPPRRPSVG